MDSGFEIMSPLTSTSSEDLVESPSCLLVGPSPVAMAVLPTKIDSAPPKIVKEAPTKISTQTPKEGSKETSKEGSEQTLESLSEQASDQAFDQAFCHIPTSTPVTEVSIQNGIAANDMFTTIGSVNFSVKTNPHGHANASQALNNTISLLGDTFHGMQVQSTKRSQLPIPKPLRVLFVMPPYLRTPPSGYGGIEAVAAALIPELKKQGVHVMVTTPNGSTVDANQLFHLTEELYPIISDRYNDVTGKVQQYIAEVMLVARDVAPHVIQDFSGMPAVLSALSSPLLWDDKYPPVVHTVHGPYSDYHDFYEAMAEFRRFSFVAISGHQFSEAHRSVSKKKVVIHNGLNPNDFVFGPGGGPILVMGRICHDKGQDHLAEYCSQNNVPLDIAGPVAEVTDAAKIREYVKASKDGERLPIHGKKDFQFFMGFQDLIDGKSIKYHGNVSGETKMNLLGNARCLAMSNRWHEPFGMVAIEAMACGTPVIAMNFGAMPEVIEHGVSGYIAKSWEEFYAFMKPESLAKLDRAKVRKYVEDKFSITAAAKKYTSLYEEMYRREK